MREQDLPSWQVHQAGAHVPPPHQRPEGTRHMPRPHPSQPAGRVPTLQHPTPGPISLEPEVRRG